MMNATRAWMVAASIGAVEAMKDQGICRWNYAIRSIQQNAKSNIRSIQQNAKSNIIRSYAEAQRRRSCSSSSSASAICEKIKEESMRKSDERMNKVMDLSCWGPNTVRF